MGADKTSVLDTAGCCLAAGSTSSHSPAPCNKLHQAQQHLPSKAREQVLTFTLCQAHTVLCRKQSTSFKNSEWLSLLRNVDLSSALPQFTGSRWDITFEGNQERVGFNTAAQSWNPPGRQGYCQRFNYCLCELKIHPDEAQAYASPNGGTNTMWDKQKQDSTKSGFYLVESADGVETLFNYSYSSTFH